MAPSLLTAAFGIACLLLPASVRESASAKLELCYIVGGIYQKVDKVMLCTACMLISASLIF